MCNEDPRSCSNYFSFIGLAICLVSASPMIGQNPVGYWPFDDGAGTKATDATGNGHNARLVNGVKWVPGKFGGGVAIEAAAKQYVSIPAIDLRGTKAVTVAFWSKRIYSTAGGHALFEASEDYKRSTTGFALFPDDDECHGVQASLHGDLGYTSNCYLQPSSGAWHYLAVVFDKSQTNGNEVAFYVDGALQTPARSLEASTNTNTFGDNPIYLFSRSGTTDFDSGTIADFRLYNTALTAEQIQQLYNSAGLVGLSVVPASASFRAGERQRFAAIGAYLDGSTRDLSNSVTWTSTAPLVATRGSGGFVLGLAPGNATIVATLARAIGFSPVLVTEPVGFDHRQFTGVIPTMNSTAAITYVQGNSATPQSSPTTVNVRFLAAQAADDLIVVVVGWNDSTSTVSSVTDTTGNVYARAAGPTVVSGALSQSIYYAKKIRPAAAGANTVTVRFSSGAAYPDIRILEYSGADPNNPVDVTAANFGKGTASSSGSAATRNPTDLIFGANLVQTGTTGPGSGFIKRLLTQPDGDIAEDRMVTATGRYSATAPVSPSGQWVMQMVAFRTQPTLVSIAVSPTNASIVAGGQEQFTATGTYSDGSTHNITTSATWTSSAPQVARIQTAGIASGIAQGQAIIRAASLQISGSARLTVTPPGNFTVSVSPASLNVIQGRQVSSTVRTTIRGAFNRAIALSISGAPPGSTVSLKPVSIAAPGSGSSIMTITAGASTSPGTYTIIVTGTGGGISHTATLRMTVTAAPNFVLAALPSLITIMRGGHGSATVTTTISGGFHNSIAFSASGAPSGTTVSFSPAAVAAPGSGRSTMTITVRASTRTGTYAIFVTGTGGGIRRTVTVNLKVTAKMTLSWHASATHGVVGYNVYRSTIPGGPFTKLNFNLISNTSYGDQTVQSGNTYWYVATSVNSQGSESSYSNRASATVP